MRNTEARASEDTFISSWATEADNENRLVMRNGLYSVLTTNSVSIGFMLN